MPPPLNPRFPAPRFPAALFLPVAVALFATVCAPAAVRAQSPVAIGAPLTGEVVLNRDVEVRVGPAENARIVMTLSKGKALNALGTPRGTTWTQVAIGGQPIGYVPAASLDPVYIPRFPATGPVRDRADTAPVAAVVPKAAWDAAAALPAHGYVVATRSLGTTEFLDGRKRRTVTLRAGQVVGLAEVQNGRADLAVPGRGRVVAGLDGLMGVAAPYPLPGMPAVPTGPLFAARLGEYVSHEEGMRAWRAFTSGPGMQYRDRPPMVWPVFRAGRAYWQMGVGPFSGVELDGACAVLAQRGFDCVPVELKTF